MNSASPEYRARMAMIQRCYNRKYVGYKNYGGRGIRVCEEWLGSFELFLAHVGFRPSTKHSLDRYPNNEGNYEPGNVRWATKIEQANNTREAALAYNNAAKTHFGELAKLNEIQPVEAMEERSK